MFWKETRTWLLKILNERIYLSRKGHRPELLSQALNLRTLLKENGYKSDSKLAGFLLRKQEIIEKLIPYNQSYGTQTTIFEQAIGTAKELTREQITA